MTRRSVNVGALDVARYENSPAYELAVVVHRETEVERAAEALAFRLKHGDTPVRVNALAALALPFDRSKARPWSEYLTFAVVDRCAVALDITAGVLLGGVVSHLHPDDWETLFWQGAYLRATDACVDAEMQLEDMAAKFTAQKLANAAAGGNERHQRRYGKPKNFVLSEWALHRDQYKGNKTKFAKDYARRVKHEFCQDIADSTIADSWLKGK